MDLAIIKFRTDVTYYQFQEEIQNGKTVRLDEDIHNTESGMRVSLILTFPLRAKFDLD
ncbi:MAG: hypothetical protein OXB84_08305 [Halobacteriovoraceae bacterium]|nr:hypothetical protein [Halobacteriovoraceae bacterium]